MKLFDSVTNMAIIELGYLARCGSKHAVKFCTSCLTYNKWRREQGLEPNFCRFGPLTNLPDYSFLDGRPVPIGHFKMKKVEHQQNLCKKIAELTHEMDVGLKEYFARVEKQNQEKQTKLDNKLKPKGAVLLKTKKKISNL